MKKCTLAIVCLIIIGISTPLHAAFQYTNLVWYQNGSSINEVTLQINESITLQLHDELAVVEFYDLEIGNFSSPVADISSVSPLMGDRSYAQPSDPDHWLLHYEWGSVLPFSDWFDHWDVTITGLSQGNYSFYSGGMGDYSILNVNVVPIPSSLLLLFFGLLFIDSSLGFVVVNGHDKLSQKWSFKSEPVWKGFWVYSTLPYLIPC